MTTAVIERTEDDTHVVTEDEIQTTDNPDEAAHMVVVPPEEKDQTPQAYVLRARIEGFPIIAICGHIFIPQKDASGLSACSPCWEIYKSLVKDHGGELPDA